MIKGSFFLIEEMGDHLDLGFGVVFDEDECHERGMDGFVFVLWEENSFRRVGELQSAVVDAAVEPRYAVRERCRRGRRH